jgi:uncharacterized protein (TIGR03000 family)
LYYPGYLGYWGWGYPGSYAYSYPNYYYAYPDYYSPFAVPEDGYVPPQPSGSPSYYGATASSVTDRARANIRVTLPAADAEVWFGGSTTRQQGTVRDFVSPPLTAGKTYTYEIRARWREGDRERDQTRTIEVHPGDSVAVTFPVSSTAATSSGG